MSEIFADEFQLVLGEQRGLHRDDYSVDAIGGRSDMQLT
jgi:hypothetical protein